MGLKLTRSLDEGRSVSKPASQGAAGDGASNAGLGHGRYAQRCDALFHMLNDTMLCEELVIARKANPHDSQHSRQQRHRWNGRSTTHSVTRGFDIGVSKIVAFEQQWFTRDLR
jgi:hypothetical protein